MDRMARWAPAAVALAHERGVQIAFGTDAAMPFVAHGSNAAEFGLLVPVRSRDLEGRVELAVVMAGGVDQTPARIE